MTTRQLYHKLSRERNKIDDNTGELLNQDFVDNMDKGSRAIRLCLFRFIGCVAMNKVTYEGIKKVKDELKRPQ